MKDNRKEFYFILLLSLVCSFFFFFKLGSYKLIDVDEPRYAEAAREMIESLNWITPYFNYELRFDKPIFFYWLISASYLIFGVSEFAARLPSAILSTALVFFTYYFGRTFISKELGLISGLILATSLEFIAIGRMSITDMALTFFICASIFSGILGSRAEAKNKKIWWWLAYLFAGIAVLTKGPVGVVLPAFILGLYLILAGKLKESFKLSYIIPGFLIFFTAVIPWYWAIISEHGNNFINAFFLKHNLARFASSKFGQHHQPFYYYFIVVIAGFFPWTVYFITSLIKYIVEIAAKIKLSANRKFDLAYFKDSDNKTLFLLASIIWFLGVFVFYSASRAKLVTYILPLFPPMALLTGNLWHEYISEGKNKKIITVSSIILAVICLIMSFVAFFGFNYLLPRDEKLEFVYINFVLTAVFIIIPVFMLLLLKKNNRIGVFSVKIVLMFAVALTALYNILPIVYKAGQADLIEYIAYSKLHNGKLLTYDLMKPSIVFYSKTKIINISDPNGLKNIISTTEPVFIIVKKSRIGGIPENIRYNIVKKGVRYCLITNMTIRGKNEIDRNGN